MELNYTSNVSSIEVSIIRETTPRSIVQEIKIRVHSNCRNIFFVLVILCVIFGFVFGIYTLTRSENNKFTTNTSTLTTTTAVTTNRTEYSTTSASPSTTTTTSTSPSTTTTDVDGIRNWI